MENALPHIHSLGWALAILFFVISFILLRSGKGKGQKVTQMIARLGYILIVASGGYMLYLLDFTERLVIKGVLGIVVIALMEIVLVRSRKGSLRGASLALLILVVLIVLVIVILMGYGRIFV